MITTRAPDGANKYKRRNQSARQQTATHTKTKQIWKYVHYFFLILKVSLRPPLFCWRTDTIYTSIAFLSYRSVWYRGVCSSRTCAAFVARPRTANKGSSKSTLTSAPREENWRAGRLWWQNWFWLVDRRNSWELVATVLFLSFLQFGSILEPILISPNIWNLPFPWR